MNYLFILLFTCMAENIQSQNFPNIAFIPPPCKPHIEFTQKAEDVLNKDADKIYRYDPKKNELIEMVKAPITITKKKVVDYEHILGWELKEGKQAAKGGK